MKKTTLYIAFTALVLSVSGQTTIPNGGFENWGNAAPGVTAEPTGWYSNKSGSSTAIVGPQTAFKETSDPHSGTSCVRIETLNIAILNIKVNGSLTTGVVNAPSTNKALGYVGTSNFTTPSDVRRVPFVGRPDSLVGWYKYTQGGAAEKAKIAAILHTGEYNDPEVPVSGNSYANTTANRIGRAIFVSPATNQGTWKRFSIPFDYASGATPEYIMLTMTSSENQMTTVAGSKFWLDDLDVVYNPAAPDPCEEPLNLAVTENATSIDIAWAAPTTAPAEGYEYAVCVEGTTPNYVATTNLAIAGITTTTGTVPATLVAGGIYDIYVRSVCDLANADTSGTIKHTITLDGTNEIPCVAPTDLTINQNATSVDLSWTAASIVPSGGYGYGILSADSLQSPIPLYNTLNTAVSGITQTQAQYTENFIIGTTYNVYLVSFCGPNPADTNLTLISGYSMKSFVFGGGVGVDETTFNDFKVYAFNNKMNVDLTDVTENNAVLTILDITGKEVLKVKLNGNEKNVISIPSSIRTGTYFYNVLGNTIQKTGKIAL